MLQKIQINDKFLKSIDFFYKIDKIIIGKNIDINEKRRKIIMKNQDGMSPLGWILTIAIVLLIAGVSIAMILG